jgi:transposase-like protein
MLKNAAMQDMTTNAMIPVLRKVLKRLHYPVEMMQERGVFVEHSTVLRWPLKILPVMALLFHRRKLPVGTSWRMDETSIKAAGQWTYLYRALDKSGDTVDFLLTANRDHAAAGRYLERAINLHGQPVKVTNDKSGANIAANRIVNADAFVDVELRQSKFLSNIVEQDHWAVKRITDPMLGCKSFWSAQKLIAGIETMRRVKTEQLHCPNGHPMSAADQFYCLAF